MASIILDKLLLLKALRIAYDVKMYVFGFACTDKFNADSDIDILVSFKDLSIEKYTDNYFALYEELEIIGEATNRILKTDENIALTNAKHIVSLHNWVIHGYDKVDGTIIWSVISRDVPLLKTEIEQLI